MKKMEQERQRSQIKMEAARIATAKARREIEEERRRNEAVVVAMEEKGFTIVCFGIYSHCGFISSLRTLQRPYSEARMMEDVVNTAAANADSEREPRKRRRKSLRLDPARDVDMEVDRAPSSSAMIRGYHIIPPSQDVWSSRARRFLPDVLMSESHLFGWLEWGTIPCTGIDVGPFKGFSVSYGEYHPSNPRLFLDDGWSSCSDQRTHAAYFRILPNLRSQAPRNRAAYIAVGLPHRSKVSFHLDSMYMPCTLVVHLFDAELQDWLKCWHYIKKNDTRPLHWSCRRLWVCRCSVSFCGVCWPIILKRHSRIYCTSSHCGPAVWKHNWPFGNDQLKGTAMGFWK